MEKRYEITVDGKLDEAVWQTAREFTGFRKMKTQGGEVVAEQTVFKILTDGENVYFGFTCLEPNMAFITESFPGRNIWGSDRVEMFIAPTGGTGEFYQFVLTFGGRQISYYYAEGGQIQPDPYAPNWQGQIYMGEDYWSAEIQIPLTAFYMTPNEAMSDKWLINPIRCRGLEGRNYIHTSCCGLEREFREFDKFLCVDAMPMRAAEDDIRIVSATLNITNKTEDGYVGQMTVETLNPVTDTFVFTSACSETATVALEAGKNEFTVPCFFEKLGRSKIALELTREKDGKLFKRHYPVTVTYEPIKLRFTLPEYRCNFYPGQDYTKVAGTVIAAKPVTLKLEGPGIETQVKMPNADGSFEFDTHGFEEGEAWLTATIDGEEKKQKIRRLAPTGHMMTWISGGNLIVNGKPVLARKMFSPGYRNSKAFMQVYNAENYHETRQVTKNPGWINPEPTLQRELKLSRAEVFEDRMPCEELLRYYDKTIEKLKDTDFAYYYIADEPECAGFSPIYLRNVYEYITDRDPYHVISIASRSCKGFVECADWFETHPYIMPENMEDGRRVYSRPMNTMGGYVDDIVKLNRPDKCAGFISSLYSYEEKSQCADYPTFDEMICHIWAAMIHGGKSLHPYGCGDMNDRPVGTEGTRYIFSSFEALEDIVLMGKRTVLYRTQEAEAVLYEHGDEKMFVLVNFTQAPQTVTVDGICGTWHSFRHNQTLTGNTFALQPLEVLIGTNTVKDAGLPTYEDTKALIDEMEAKRVAGSSKLVALRHNLTQKASGVSVSKYKFFDGVRDNLAGSVAKTGERYYELGFGKETVSFSKVVLSGWNLKQNVALKLRINGELVSPDVADTQAQEWSVTFCLRDAVTPEALRLEFSGDESMELYELEVF